jgi:hypothetical protein
MTDTNWRFVRYLDNIEHEYGYMLQTSAYVCPGWMVLIQDMLREIDARHDGKEDHPVLTTIKEKFGTLRVYGYNIDDTDQAIIDADYEETIKVVLYNTDPTTSVRICAGQRIAQLVFAYAYRRTELVKDEQRTGGLGSTGTGETLSGSTGTGEILGTGEPPYK